jgi:NAD(P)H dehydrogenase (quinone)
MLITGIPFTQSQLSTTTSGGTPYGASHWTGPEGSSTLSEDERVLARALGRRVAQIAHKLGGEA